MKRGKGLYRSQPLLQHNTHKPQIVPKQPHARRMAQQRLKAGAVQAVEYELEGASALQVQAGGSLQQLRG